MSPRQVSLAQTCPAGQSALRSHSTDSSPPISPTQTTDPDTVTAQKQTSLPPQFGKALQTPDSRQGLKQSPFRQVSPLAQHRLPHRF
jgi:hypothetical protein